MINGLVNEEVWEEFGKWLKNNAIDLRKVKVVGIGGNINKIFKISKNKVGTPLSIKKFKKTLDKLESLSEKKLLINYKLNLIVLMLLFLQVKYILSYENLRN